MSEQTIEAPPKGTADDPTRIITISQIVDGDRKCHCGADAVLVVDTEPDGEPGPTCFDHAQVWIRTATTMVDRLFGPKDTPS